MDQYAPGAARLTGFSQYACRYLGRHRANVVARRIERTLEMLSTSNTTMAESFPNLIYLDKLPLCYQCAQHLLRIAYARYAANQI